MSKILILANHYNTLRIFRRELLQTMSKEGHKVVVAIPPCDDENKDLLRSYGCKVVFTDMERRGMNPLHDIKLFFNYLDLLRRGKPEKVVTYTIKPNIYGSMACKLFKIPHYANVTGLGSAFQGHGLTRKLVSFLYRISMNKADRIFFENVGNRDTLVQDGIVREEQTVVMAGAGVNLKEFYACEYPSETEPMRFLFVGRIMQEKGVDELFEIIPKVKETYPDAEFEFIGWYEDNYKEKVEQLEAEGMIKFYGFQANVKPFIERAQCVILPSYHEGMSNTLLESAAMCRPLITSNIHGCKEAVEEGVNGYLAKVKDSESLYEQVMKFAALSYEDKKKMGQAGRKRMESVFDKEIVVEKTMEELGL